MRSPTTESAERLEPCPFCGGTACIENGPPELWYASCRNPDCLVDGKIMHSEYDAIAAWNRRAQPVAAPVLTDLDILENEVLQYHFGLNGGAGPVSKKGWKIINAVLKVAAMQRGEGEKK